MRQISTPKRFLALTLSAGILTGGLALSSPPPHPRPTAPTTPPPPDGSIVSNGTGAKRLVSTTKQIRGLPGTSGDRIAKALPGCLARAPTP